MFQYAPFQKKKDTKTGMFHPLANGKNRQMPGPFDIVLLSHVMPCQAMSSTRSDFQAVGSATHEQKIAEGHIRSMRIPRQFFVEPSHSAKI